MLNSVKLYLLIFLNCTLVFLYAITVPYGQSEIVKVVGMGDALTMSSLTQTNCPHLQTGLVTFNSLYPFNLLTNAMDISISSSVLLKSDSIPSNIILNRITILPGGSLIFDDAPISLSVREIYVQATGSLLIGSETCRLGSNIKITFYGTKADSSTVDSTSGLTSKGLISEGFVDIHGKQYHPTWTRLALTAVVGSNSIILQQNVNWEVGQQILITTTIFYDCADIYYSSWCNGVRHQNELRYIKSISMNDQTKQYLIQLDSPLLYEHYAGLEYQGEVALLTRKILIQGSQSGDQFGAHTKVKGALSQGRFSGVQGINMGQLNILGRYPFHFHLLGQSIGANKSYFQDCSVVNSNFRAYTVHGTNNTRLSRNVAFNITGMAVYIEDGVEENNLFEYNFVSFITPIYRPANGGWGQGGESFSAISESLLIPADTSASGFYIPNAMNTFIGNAVSGGWSGFAFPNVAVALGDFQGTIPSDSNYLPLHRPLKSFYGNTAHSSGFYWRGHGSCVYVGAWLAYDKNGVMTYNSGRNSRNTFFSNGSTTHMLFEETKTFLCNIGVAHWGNNIQISSAEMHDSLRAAMLFGQSALHNALININSNNPNNKLHPWTSRIGFQFYDTWVQTILSNVKFRNAKTSNGDCAVRYMDHSDHYTPQGINSVIGLKFENIADTAVVCIQNCGKQCGTKNSTMSSRMYSVWDFDGSLSGKGIPSIVGSNLNWWDVDATCSVNPSTKLWSCPWEFDYMQIGNHGTNSYPNRTIAYLQLYVPGGLMDGCDYAKFSSCTDQYAPYTVGRVSQWGKSTDSNYINLSPWEGVSGISNTGWYWRVKAPDYGIDGAPSSFQIDPFYQLSAGAFVVIAIAYPPNTKFTIYLDYWGKILPNTPMASSLQSVLSTTENVLLPDKQNCAYSDWWNWFYMCSNSGTPGFTWYFDGLHLYLRVVPYNCYNRNSYERKKCFSNYYQAYGAKVWNIQSGFKLSVAANCTECTVQSTYGGVTYYSVSDVAPATSFLNTVTASPSIKISQSPSLNPSLISSLTPSINPSIKPTNHPSVRPSTRTTSFPSVSPSTKPLVTLSQVPTAKPSTKPTYLPTILNSKTPTAKPSINPTNNPSLRPSRVPTAKPSINPTNNPSLRPSRVPTAKPSLKPTNNPSLRPSRVPTAKPSIKPINNPSLRPTRVPTTKPSLKPTTLPTFLKSFNPSTRPSTRVPSLKSTVKPSNPTVESTYTPT